MCMDMHITLSDDQRDFLRTQLLKHINDHKPDYFDSQSGPEWMKEYEDWTWLDQFIEDLYMFDYRPGAPGWKEFKSHQ